MAGKVKGLTCACLIRWSLLQALSLAEREKQVLKSQIRRSTLGPRAQVRCSFQASVDAEQVIDCNPCGNGCIVNIYIDLPTRRARAPTHQMEQLAARRLMLVDTPARRHTLAAQPQVRSAVLKAVSETKQASSLDNDAALMPQS